MFKLIGYTLHPLLCLMSSVYITASLIITGIQTSQNAKFYAMSARFDKFSSEGKTVVIQFTVKHEQKIDCGGGYVKVKRCM